MYATIHVKYISIFYHIHHTHTYIHTYRKTDINFICRFISLFFFVLPIHLKYVFLFMIDNAPGYSFQ